MISGYKDTAKLYQAMVPELTLNGLITANPFMSLKISELEDGANILDAACGSGWDAIAIKNGLPNLGPKRNFNVSASDCSEHMLDQAAFNLGAFFGSDSCVDLRLCTLSGLASQPDWVKKFDIVIIPNAITQLHDMEYTEYDNYLIESLKGVGAVLKPDGKAIVDTRDWEKTLERNFRKTQRSNNFSGKSYLTEYDWSLGCKIDGEHFARMSIWDNQNKKGKPHTEDIRFAGKTKQALESIFRIAGFGINSEALQERGLCNEPFVTFELTMR